MSTVKSVSQAEVAISEATLYLAQEVERLRDEKRELHLHRRAQQAEITRLNAKVAELNNGLILGEAKLADRDKQIAWLEQQLRAHAFSAGLPEPDLRWDRDIQVNRHQTDWDDQAQCDMEEMG